MIKSCEYEDINKADCINCFNGLPTNECKYHEEIEGKKLRQMVHERAERDRKKVYNKAIDDFANTLKENYDYLPQILSQEVFGGYIDEYAEQLKAGGKE